MVVSDGLRSLELRGGDPALDFANTVEGVRGAPADTDHLPTYAELVGWSVHAGLLSEREAAPLRRHAARAPRAAAAAHRRARALRGTIIAVFDPLATGGEPGRAALDDLRAAHGRAVAVAQAALRARGGGAREHAWTWSGDDLERPLWPVAVAAVDLLRSAERLARLKVCAECCWLFLDRSRNHSRRWCSMQECGAHAKMRRYRATHRTA